MRLFLIFSATLGRKYVLFWAVLFCLLLASMLQIADSRKLVLQSRRGLPGMNTLNRRPGAFSANRRR